MPSFGQIMQILVQLLGKNYEVTSLGCRAARDLYAFGIVCMGLSSCYWEPRLFFKKMLLNDSL